MLLFTACVERGSNLTPKEVMQEPTQNINTPKVKQIKPNPTQKKTTVTPALKSKVLSEIPKNTKNTPEEKPSFSLSDETQNQISGFFIIIIGLLILI